MRSNKGGGETSRELPNHGRFSPAREPAHPGFLVRRLGVLSAYGGGRWWKIGGGGRRSQGRRRRRNDFGCTAAVIICYKRPFFQRVVATVPIITAITSVDVLFGEGETAKQPLAGFIVPGLALGGLAGALELIGLFLLLQDLQLLRGGGAGDEGLARVMELVQLALEPERFLAPVVEDQRGY